MGLKPGLRGNRLANNRLINGTARHGCYVDYVDSLVLQPAVQFLYLLTKLQLSFRDFASAMKSDAPGSERMTSFQINKWEWYAYVKTPVHIIFLR
jgi:hypothetical protein